MKRINYILLALLMPMFALAQSGSPSSRFGYGELVDNVPAELRALGGVVTGMRSNHVINPAQPASYTSADSLSFMFDMAVGLGWTHYKDVYGVKNVPIGSLEYITMQFPLWKRWIAFSCGIMPFTHVNYDFTLSGTTKSGDYSYKINYMGEGGLSQVYAGLGFNILDWAAVGANFYYMFGNATNYTIQTFSASDVTGSKMIQYIDMSAFRTKVGAQIFHTFANRHNIILGATFDPKLPLGGDYYMVEVQSLDSSRVDQKSETPMSWSVGASYTWNKQLTLAADYSRQEWSDALYFGSYRLQDRQRISLGAQYQHNMFGLRYYERMIWRVGAAVMNSYTKGNDWQDFTVSLGMGFPLRTTASMINTTIEYGRKCSFSGMEEHNLRLILDVAINEQWFHKRKL